MDRQIVAIFAVDWAFHESQVDARDDFTMWNGWVVGMLVCDDDDKVVLAHNWFPADNQVRATTAIPKVCILRREDYPWPAPA